MIATTRRRWIRFRNRLPWLVMPAVGIACIWAAFHLGAKWP